MNVEVTGSVPSFPRVLVVTNMYPSEQDPAYGVFVEAQVRALAAAGVNLDVLFVNGRASSTAYLSGIRGIRQHLSRGQFDLVHAHYGLTGLVAAFHALPLVITFWGDDLLGTPSKRGGITLKSRATRWASQFAAWRAAALICVSQELRGMLRRPSDRARAQVIPGGIDVKRFCPGDRRTARQRLGLPMDAKIVLFPNTPTEIRKRLDLARAAVDILRERDAQVQLMIVTGVENEKMPDYYRAADCLLLTSDWEGSPTVVKEALCCDVPVVSVDAGDSWHWLALAPGCKQVAREVEAISVGLWEVLSGVGRVDGSAVREQLDGARIANEVIGVYRATMRKRAKG